MTIVSSDPVHFHQMLFDMNIHSIANFLLVLLATVATTTNAQNELVLGNFRTLDHQGAGEVVVISDQVLEIRNFVYDGQGRK